MSFQSDYCISPAPLYNHLDSLASKLNAEFEMFSINQNVEARASEGSGDSTEIDLLGADAANSLCINKFSAAISLICSFICLSWHSS
jgi:hypothetical protein